MASPHEEVDAQVEDIAGPSAQPRRSTTDGGRGGKPRTKMNIGKMTKAQLIELVKQLMTEEGDEEEGQADEDAVELEVEEPHEEEARQVAPIASARNATGRDASASSTPTNVYTPDAEEIPDLKVDPNKVKCNTFDGTGYVAWSYNFKVQVQAAGMWGFFSGEWVAPDHDVRALTRYKKGMLQAFSILSRSVTPAISTRLKPFADDLESAAKAWAYLGETYHPRDDATRGYLMRKLLTARIEKGECIQDYCNRVCAIRDELLLIGASVAEEDFIVYLKQGLPAEWNDAVRSINRREEKQTEAWVVKQLLMEERLMANSWRHDDTTTTPSVFATQRQDMEGGTTKGGGGQGRQAQAPFQGKCSFCKEVGHKWRKCPKAPEGWTPTWTEDKNKKSKETKEPKETKETKEKAVRFADEKSNGGETKAVFNVGMVGKGKEAGSRHHGRNRHAMKDGTRVVFTLHHSSSSLLDQDAWYLDSAAEQHCTLLEYGPY